jgi:hypothetical protein
MRLIFIYFFVLLVISVKAQQLAIVRGRVIDAKTKEPIPFATVFLANTFIGTRATENGFYVLKNIPFGKYDLIVSSIGYNLYSKAIAIDLSEKTADVVLTYEVKVLKEVEVKSSQSDYLRLLKIFKQNFLGSTRNAAKCTISNISDVELNYNEEDKVLNAYCDQPIVIENMALGYRLYYFLQKFRLDLKQGYCTLLGVPRFETMIPENKNQLIKWAKERERAFNGSMIHFMRSLKYSCLHENNFDIYFLEQKTLNDRFPESEKINDTLYSVIHTDEHELFNRKTLKNSILKIAYHAELQEANYDNRQGANLLPQTSYLKIKKSNLIIHDNGYYEEPLNYHLDGYLGWSTKIAEQMPVEYQKGKPLNFNEIGKEFEKDYNNDDDQLLDFDSLVGGKNSNSEFCMISGTVRNESTNQPISNAEVFFDNSMYYASSDNEGKFVLNQIPRGVYDIIVAAPGFNYIKKTIFLNGSIESSDWFIKKSESKTTLTVGVTEADIRILKFFFNGRTENSKKCKIKNINDIYFKKDKEFHVIRAYAQKPLEIENGLLGYSIVCYLKEFTYDFNKRTYIVDGAAYLKQMKALNNKQEKNWKSARMKSYKGSFQHFMQSLHERSLLKNNFLIYNEVNGQEIAIDEEFIFADRANIPLRIKVVYLSEPSEYTYDFNTFVTPTQTSYLTLTKRLLEHYPNRYLSHPVKYELKGYMNWTNVFAEMLPFDFVPTN